MTLRCVNPAMSCLVTHRAGGILPYTTVYTTPEVITIWALKNLSPDIEYPRGCDIQPTSVIVGAVVLNAINV